jgi:uncharacterized ubiquitin-like protein YukD
VVEVEEVIKDLVMVETVNSKERVKGSIKVVNKVNQRDTENHLTETSVADVDQIDRT